MPCAMCAWCFVLCDVLVTLISSCMITYPAFARTLVENMLVENMPQQHTSRFPPSFRAYFLYGQKSSLPQGKRLTAALPGEMRRQLDSIAQLCQDDGEETRVALLGLEDGTRRFVAAMSAPGCIASTPHQWSRDQRALRDAAEAFLPALLSFTHELHSSQSVHQLAALQPKAALEGPFAALEAVYPQVSARHKQRVERLAR